MKTQEKINTTKYEALQLLRQHYVKSSNYTMTLSTLTGIDRLKIWKIINGVVPLNYEDALVLMEAVPKAIKDKRYIKYLK